MDDFSTLEAVLSTTGGGGLVSFVAFLLFRRNFVSGDELKDTLMPYARVEQLNSLHLEITRDYMDRHEINRKFDELKQGQDSQETRLRTIEKQTAVIIELLKELRAKND